MIEIQYPLLNRTMCDTVETKERAIEVLQNVSNNLINVLAKVNYQLEELQK